MTSIPIINLRTIPLPVHDIVELLKLDNVRKAQFWVFCSHEVEPFLSKFTTNVSFFHNLDILFIM